MVPALNAARRRKKRYEAAIEVLGKHLGSAYRRSNSTINGRTSMSKRNWKSTALSLPVVLVAAGAYAQAPQATDVTKNLTPVTDTMLRDPPASDWLMWRRA